MVVHILFLYFIFIYFVFRDRGRDRQRQADIDQSPLICVPTGHQTHTPGMCPDRESN